MAQGRGVMQKAKRNRTRNHITVSLQFPERQAVTLKLHPAGDGEYRVKVGHAWTGREAMTPEAACMLAARLLRQAEGLPAEERTAAPDMRPGQLVVLGDVCLVEPGEYGGAGGGYETELWRVLCPPFEHASGAWCVFVGRGMHPLRNPRRVRCADCRPANAARS